MVEIHLSGPLRYVSKREARDVIKWMAEELRLNNYKNPIRLDVKFKKNLFKRTGTGGSCIWEDSYYRPREFTIECDGSRSYCATMKTLIHEMIHVKQFASGKMQDYCHFSLVRWQGCPIDSSCIDYWDLPWEQEAYTYERKYWNDYNKEIVKKTAKRKSKKRRTK